MTREEAIEIINRENDPNDKKVWEVFPEYREALDMAIQALSQEPCDDAVSREAVLTIASIHTLTVDETVKAIKNLPSVTQKSGKWTLMYEPKNMVVCSECGKCAYMYQDKTSAFCPNCGAKMVEPQEGSDKE